MRKIGISCAALIKKYGIDRGLEICKESGFDAVDFGLEIYHLGDAVYGGDKTKFQAIHKGIINGQCLHAKELHLIHPRTHDLMTFTSPLPPEFEKTLEILRKTC